MIMPSISLKVAKSNFFDRAKVQAMMDKKTWDALSRAGAYVRTRARTSIRKRKGTSQPGAPPFSHPPHLLRGETGNAAGIVFSFDQSRFSVVIGPVRLNRFTGVPGLLEMGGIATRFKNGKPHSARYRPRPYMRPALAAELPRLPGYFRSNVTTAM